MAKATLPFGEWRPDISLLDNQYATIADNVFAALNCYKPIPSLLPFSNAALPAPCVGLKAARKLDGTWDIYAGTRTNLYKWTWAGWTDVSRTVGGAYNVPATGELWSMEQFGSRLFACNINDVLQYIDIESGTNFAAAPGSPPQAHTVKTIGDFLVLGGLSSNSRKIRWSGLNDSSQWTIGVGLCDEQEFVEGGPVMAIAGNELGYILQDRSIRLMQFLPGDINFIFTFSRVVKDKGSISEFAATTVGDVLYFMAEDGPYSLSGNQLNPIGQEKVSEWWRNNSDINRRIITQSLTANRPYVLFAFHGSSAASTYDRVLIYHWLLQRWTSATIYAQQWAQLGSKNLDLDTTGSEPGDAYLDSPPAPLPPNQPQSLDSFAYIGGRPAICAVDPQGRLCALNGPALLATMETAEAHLVPGMRAFCSEVYPLCDSANGTISVETRERLADATVRGSETPIEIIGSASVLTSGRLHRFRYIIPAGETWTTAEGLLAEAQPDGHA